MKKMYTKKKEYGKTVFYAVVMLVLVGMVCVSGCERIKSSETSANNNYTGTTLQEVSTDKYVGHIESIMEYMGEVDIAVHYPVVGNEIIDAYLVKDVTNKVEAFKQELVNENITEAELHGDYNSYLVDDKYISIAMIYETSSPSFASGNTEISNYVYNISDGKQLLLTDIISDNKMSEFIDAVAAKVQTNYDFDDPELKANITTYFAETPYNFYLNKDGLVIRFERYSILPGSEGAPEVTLPYTEIKSLFKEGFTVGEVQSQLNIQQDTTQEMDINTDKQERNIDPNKPMVALTFDDGPHPKYTRKILDALKEYDGAATFYVLGNRASAYGDVLQEIINSGSEVGNHSWSHNNYSKSTASEIKTDKNKTQDRIKEILGKAPATLRAPYGAVNQTVFDSVEMPVILWSIDTTDWKDKNKDLTIEKATSNVKDGDIILMHDIWGETADAVPEIAKRLHGKGFQLVTVSEMAEAKGVKMQNGKKYSSFK